jgi:hypothetical protein
MSAVKVLTENNRKDTVNFITEYNAVSKTTYDDITNCVASLRSIVPVFPKHEPSAVNNFSNIKNDFMDQNKISNFNVSFLVSLFEY